MEGTVLPAIFHNSADGLYKKAISLSDAAP